MSATQSIQPFTTDVIDQLARRLSGLRGWHRLALAASLGGLSALVLPPVNLVVVLLLTLPVLLWLLDGTLSAAKGARSAFAIGWWFGFGHHLLGLYWISAALFTDIEKFWWALPLSAAGLPVVLAIFAGLATLIYRWLLIWAGGQGRSVGLGRSGGRGIWSRLAKPLLFAGCWSFLEWMRGWIFTGFPWNLFGYGWESTLPVLQSVSLVGIYGLTLLTVLVAALPVALARGVEDHGGRAGSWIALLLGLMVFGALGFWGNARLDAAPEPGSAQASVADVRLRLVQPNIDQRMKWVPEERERNVLLQMELSASPADQPPTHIIWAETAVPMFVEQDERVRQALASVTPEDGLLITGAPRLKRDAEGQAQYFNSMVALDRAGEIVASYDKAHLVPFGEYMPLRRWLPVGAIAGNGAEFSPGPGVRTVPLRGLPPASPLICYEVIFPGEVVASEGERPGWLLNLTNDAWYGHTAGPYQHLAISRVRAVEEGLPLVRVANTGISAVFDGYGRVLAYLPLGQRGVVDSVLPIPSPKIASYGWDSMFLFGVMLLACVVCGCVARQLR